MTQVNMFDDNSKELVTLGVEKSLLNYEKDKQSIFNPQVWPLLHFSLNLFMDTAQGVDFTRKRNLTMEMLLHQYRTTGLFQSRVREKVNLIEVVHVLL
jgi:hypothetical protein